MNSNDPILIKLFLGFVLTSEIKMYLSQNSEWKEEKLFQTQKLTEVQFQSRDYIGNFIESPLNYEQLKQKISGIREDLQHYCSKLNMDKQTIYLFPQLFLT